MIKWTADVGLTTRKLHRTLLFEHHYWWNFNCDFFVFYDSVYVHLLSLRTLVRYNKVRFIQWIMNILRLVTSLLKRLQWCKVDSVSLMCFTQMVPGVLWVNVVRFMETKKKLYKAPPARLPPKSTLSLIRNIILLCIYVCPIYPFFNHGWNIDKEVNNVLHFMMLKSYKIHHVKVIILDSIWLLLAIA